MPAALAGPLILLDLAHMDHLRADGTSRPWGPLEAYGVPTFGRRLNRPTDRKHATPPARGAKWMPRSLAGRTASGILSVTMGAGDASGPSARSEKLSRPQLPPPNETHFPATSTTPRVSTWATWWRSPRFRASWKGETRVRLLVAAPVLLVLPEQFGEDDDEESTSPTRARNLDQASASNTQRLGMLRGVMIRIDLWTSSLSY
jgi:hypothetical protein